MSPQALRFAQGRILGETNTSWYVGEVTLDDGKPPRRIAFILYNSRVHVPPVHNEEIHPTPGVQDMFQPVPGPGPMIMGRMSQVHQGPRPRTSLK